MLEVQIHDSWELEVMLILSILEIAEGEENRAELRDLRSSTLRGWGEAKKEGNQEKPTERLKRKFAGRLTLLRKVR